MRYIRFSHEFSDIANLVIIDGIITKNRNEIQDEDVYKEVEARNKVIIQNSGKLICYFKKEDKKLLVDIISRLCNPILAYDNITIITD